MLLLVAEMVSDAGGFEQIEVQWPLLALTSVHVVVGPQASRG